VLPRPGAGPLLPGVSETSQRSLVLLDDEVQRIVEQRHSDVLALLRDNRSRLDALANALLEHETLGEDEAYAAAGLSAPSSASAPGELAAAAFDASRPAA
jgi:cell division protease FtsH